MVRLFVLVLGLVVLSSAREQFMEEKLDTVDLEESERKFEKTMGVILYTVRGVIDLAQTLTVDTYNLADSVLFLSWAVDDFFNALFYYGSQISDELRCPYWQIQYFIHRLLFLIPSMMEIPYSSILLTKYNIEEYCGSEVDHIEEAALEVSKKLPSTLQFNIPEIEVKDVEALLSCVYFQGYAQIDSFLAKYVDKQLNLPAYYLLLARSNDFSKIGTPYCEKAIKIKN